MSRGDDNSLVGQVIVYSVTLIVILLLATLVGTFAANIIVTDDEAKLSPTTGDAALIDDTEDDVPDGTQVWATRGYGLSFDEDDHVNATGIENVADNSWTVCATSELDNEANPDATMVVAAHANGAIRLLYDGNGTGERAWAVVYEHPDTGDDAVLRAPLSETSDASSLTPVCGRYNETTGTLGIWVDGTEHSTTTLSSSTTPIRTPAGCTCTIDEIRIVNGTVADSRLQTYGSNPTIPFRDSDRVARLMFDENGGSSTEVYFADTDAEISGASWTVAITNPELTAGQDFELLENPFRLRVLADGKLDGAPVVYVTYVPSGSVFTDQINSIIQMGVVGFTILGVTLLFFPVVALLLYLHRQGVLNLRDITR